MGVAEDKRDAERWQARAKQSLAAARDLFTGEHFSACANRAYCAAYQACVAVCLLHGDRDKFPSEWNNPTHEQLPELLLNNGKYTLFARRRITATLLRLRRIREDADYRIGRTVDGDITLKCLHETQRLFEYIEFGIGEENG